MYKKISHSVQCNSYGNVEPIIEVLDGSVVHQYDRGNCKYDKKIVIFFHRPIVAVIVMVFVKRPQKTMHDIFMNKPGHSFHDKKSNRYDQEIHILLF